MGKKKQFIDKKKSATFQLMARDSSDPSYSSGTSGDHIFVRVDNNQYTPDYVNDGADESVFADADEDEDYDGEVANGAVQGAYEPQTSGLPDHVRREILELGFPDDGYNYLTHMREIKNTGGGSAYYENPKASFEQLPRDIKAYDASKVELSRVNDVSEEKSMYSVASKTVGVRLQKVVDPEVAAILDDSDSSKFDSDIEDLEEDFVVQANVFEGPLDEDIDTNVSLAADSRVGHVQGSGATKNQSAVTAFANEKNRERRPLDEQFDLLELQEYADSDEEFDGYMDEEDENQESLTEKLNNAFKNHPSDNLDLKKEIDDDKLPELAPEVILRCKEYGEKYEHEDDDLEEVLVEESSDESEKWDCETIVTTYSTLDNHPGKIGAPEARRKKKLTEAIFGGLVVPNQVITLKGKERLPVDFLPRSKKQGEEKSKDENDKRTELLRKKTVGQESKEEKKERKSALKLERREARQMKKEVKGLYKSEGQRAQKVAAFTGPSSIHLM